MLKVVSVTSNLKPDTVNRCVFYMKINSAKVHPDPIRNDWALAIFEDGRPNKNNKKNKMGSVPHDSKISKGKR